MEDLRQQLAASLPGRLAIVGLGNLDHGDDGLGLHLLELLADWANQARRDGDSVTLVPAGTLLERRLHELTGSRFDRVLFVDAVELRALAGSAALLDRSTLKSMLPQISTHRISLSMAAELIEAGGTTRVTLLGVQPGSLRPGRELTAQVRETVELLSEWIIGCDRPRDPVERSGTDLATQVATKVSTGGEAKFATKGFSRMALGVSSA
jgi:hydrogenase maturation protease